MVEMVERVRKKRKQRVGPSRFTIPLAWLFGCLVIGHLVAFLTILTILIKPPTDVPGCPQALPSRIRIIAFRGADFAVTNPDRFVGVATSMNNRPLSFSNAHSTTLEDTMAPHFPLLLCSTQITVGGGRKRYSSQSSSLLSAFPRSIQSTCRSTNRRTSHLDWSLERKRARLPSASGIRQRLEDY